MVIHVDRPRVPVRILLVRQAIRRHRVLRLPFEVQPLRERAIEIPLPLAGLRPAEQHLHRWASSPGFMAHTGGGHVPSWDSVQPISTSYRAVSSVEGNMAAFMRATTPAVWASDRWA